MLYANVATGTVEAVAKQVEEAALARKFGVLGVYDLRQKMADKGLEFDRECRIVEVCQPAQAKKVLEANMAISTALPCRIAVYEDGGKVVVSTIKPTALIGLFETPAVASAAEEVEGVMVAIIDEVCK